MRRRITQFLKQTSIKGIPRIFRTKSYILRTVWVISVTCCLSMAAHQVILLTKGYLEYTSVISLKEYYIDFGGQTNNAVQFPDVTFCNLNPFSLSTHSLNDITSLEAYHKHVVQKTSCENCSVQKEKDLLELRGELLTTSGYHIHIGASNAKLVSHTQEQLIVSCNALKVSGLHQRKVECKDIATVVPYYDYIYYNCYTIRLPPPTPENMYYGVIVVLHLNNYFEIIEQRRFLTPHNIPGQMGGALMLFHEPDRLPVATRNAINLPPGHFVSAKLQFVQRIRLAAPYGDCKHRREMSVHYQQIICYSTCVHMLVLRSCGCVDYTGYDDVVDLASKSGEPPCLSVKISSKMLNENWECVKRIRLNSTAHCLSTCPIPCEEMEYNHDVSSDYKWWQFIHYPLDGAFIR